MRRRNWAAGVGLLLGLVGFLSYFIILGMRIGPATSSLRDSALLHLIVIGIGLGVSVVAIRRTLGPRPQHRGRWLAPILAAINVCIATLFILFLFPMATMPHLEGVPAVGGAAPDFTLLDETGTGRQLAAMRGRNVVLVFYRGHW